jgi:sialic acid synthase SpsE
LLATLGWMRFDRAIGLGAHRLGLVMMIGALAAGAVYLVKNPEESQDLPAD